MQVTRPVGNLRTMGVTPQIMSRAVLDPMAAYLEVGFGDWARRLDLWIGSQRVSHLCPQLAGFGASLLWSCMLCSHPIGTLPMS